MSKEGVIHLMLRWWHSAQEKQKLSLLRSMKKTMDREGVIFADLGITSAEFEKRKVAILMHSWNQAEGTYQATLLTEMRENMDREGITFDDLGITVAQYETRLKKCKMVGRAKGLWTTANLYNDLGALLSLENGMKSAGLQLDEIEIDQKDFDDLRWRLYCTIARRDLASCRRAPNVVLLDYIPQYLEKIGAKLENIDTNDQEMRELRIKAHLSQAKLIWSKLPEWNVCRAHLRMILHHLQQHQQLVSPIELEEEQKFPYNFSLLGTTRDEFMKLWQQTAPPEPSEMPRTQEHQGTLFADCRQKPKRQFNFRRREQPAAPKQPIRQAGLFTSTSS